jgi:hypothetical protein
LSFFKIIVGFITEATLHAIVTFAPRFKSHPRSEMDTLDGTAGAAAKVNVDDMKESAI